MISTPELQDHIERLICTTDALTATTRRVALVFRDALIRYGVSFHAVNDGFHAPGDGYDHAVKVCLSSPSGAGWQCHVSEGIGSDSAQYQEQIDSITTLSDSELAKIADKWAEKIASISKLIVFKNLYVPKAVEHADGYNDLHIAFRIFRAWDCVRSCYVLRFDAVFKDLSA